MNGYIDNIGGGGFATVDFQGIPYSLMMFMSISVVMEMVEPEPLKVQPLVKYFHTLRIPKKVALIRKLITY